VGLKGLVAGVAAQRFRGLLPLLSLTEDSAEYKTEADANAVTFGELVESGLWPDMVCGPWVEDISIPGVFYASAESEPVGISDCQ
jgi:hypothetical protein